MNFKSKLQVYTINNISHILYIIMKKYSKLKEVEFRILRHINVCKILDTTKEQDTNKLLNIILYFSNPT
jgi:hypothetical protein